MPKAYSVAVRFACAAALGAGLIFGVPLVAADEVGRQATLSSLVPSEWALTTFVNTTSQISNRKQIDGEVLASFDLVGSVPGYGGQINFYIEGDTTPSNDGVARQLASANADAGTALTANGQGRFQLSELNYVLRFIQSQLAVGLIDPAAYLDVSAVANNERKQFLNTQLKNNPTIALPNYALAMAYHAESNGAMPGYTAFVSSSHGLANNEDASYQSLVNVVDRKKGTFAAIEFYRTFDRSTPRAGVWSNTGDRTNQFGAYTSIDFDVAQIDWNLRAGWADPTTSKVQYLAALAAMVRTSVAEIGFGASYLRAPGNAVINNLNGWQAETFARMRLTKQVHVTPSLQYINNSELVGNQIGLDATVGSLRLTYEM